MKITVILTACFLLAGVADAEHNNEWHDLLSRAKNTNKCIAVKVLDSGEQITFFDSVIFSGFIETSLYASKSEDVSIIKKYKVKTYPSIIMLNSAGQLLLPVKTISSSEEMRNYARIALELKYDSKPLAQMDLDYKDNKMGSADMFEYISKRTSLELDNGNVMDAYTDIASKQDLLSEKTLKLFVEKNNMNIPGKFYGFVQNNREQIKTVLKIGDTKYRLFINRSMEYNLKNIYARKDERRLNKIIEIKSNLFAENYDLVYNELMTKYFYKTHQPLKLLPQARTFVNLVTEEIKNQSRGNSHSIASFQISSAAHLRNAAQYVMEIINNKTVLNEALKWSIFADETAGLENEMSETRAYILYKLGRKDEAVAGMEKIYYSIPETDTEKRKTTGINLIKMKRGERVY